MDQPAAPFTVARFISDAAHGARNQLATLRAAQHLIDGADAASDIRAAVDAVQVLFERSVVAARVELGERPPDVTMGASELVRFAARRANREGWLRADEITIGGPGAAVEVLVPGAWMERLLADLLHVAAEEAAVEIGAPGADGLLSLEMTVDPQAWLGVAVFARTVADASGAHVAYDAERHVATLVLPRA